VRRAIWIKWTPKAGPLPPPVSPEFTGAAKAGRFGRDKSPLVDLRGELIQPGEVALVPADFFDGLRKRVKRDPVSRRLGFEYPFGEGKTRAGDRKDDGHVVEGPFYGEIETPNGEFEVVKPEPTAPKKRGPGRPRKNP
jgi:hypothetical protein